MKKISGTTFIAAMWTSLLMSALASAQGDDSDRQAMLAACADEIVYGDPAFDNVLEYSYEGKRRRLHFEAMEVEQTRGRYEVRVPRIIKGNPTQYGWINAATMSASLSMGPGGGTRQGSPVGLHVVIEPGQTFASDQVELRSFILPPLDCLQEMPDFPSMFDLFSGRSSDFTYTWGKQGEEPWLILESRLKSDDATLRLAVSSPAQRRPTSAVPAATAYLGQGALEAAGLVYDALDVIHVEPLAAQQSQGQGAVPRPFTLPLPAAGSRLARTLGDSAEVYDYQVLENDLVVVDQHRIAPAAGERDPDRIFDMPVDPLGAPLNELTLDDSTRVHRFVISRVTHSALPPLRIDTDAVEERPRRPAMLALHELPASLPPVSLSRPEPQSFTLTNGEQRIGLVLRSTSREGRELIEHVEASNETGVTAPVATVIIDPATGRPISRQERLVAPIDELSLDIDITYGDRSIYLQAANTQQGKDTVELQLPKGVFDARQVLSLIPFLPLAQGESQTLYMLDLGGHQSMRSSASETVYTAHLRPYVSRLSLALEGRETLSLTEGDTPVLRVRATLVGLMPPPLGELLRQRPELDAEGGQMFELLVRAETPHQLMRILVGDQEISADSHGRGAMGK